MEVVDYREFWQDSSFSGKCPESDKTGGELVRW
jgi:hypothetical protein